MIARIDLDIFFPLKARMAEGDVEKFANTMGLARGYHVVISLVLLEHQPHRFDEFFGVTPVTFRIKVAEIQFFLEPGLDMRDSTGDLASDEGFATARRFMIEKNAVAGVQIVGLSIIYSYPEGEHFRAT